VQFANYVAVQTDYRALFYVHLPNFHIWAGKERTKNRKGTPGGHSAKSYQQHYHLAGHYSTKEK
jgi:hypothetical protein